MTFLKKLRAFLREPFEHRRTPKISIIIPYSSKNKARDEAFQWLVKYWEYSLPHAEIIIGKSSDGKVFCKSEAINEAIRRSKGKVLAVVDADTYLPAERVNHCANIILEEQERGNNIWFIPYRRLYRLNKHITKRIVKGSAYDIELPCPLPKHLVDITGQNRHYGYRFCAMAFIIPRKAWEFIDGFDERFEGWGGEDVSFMKTLDTVWGKHKTVMGCVYHFWHPYMGTYEARKWDDQELPNANDNLSYRYVRADKRPSLMWNLISEEKRRQ
jgi:hypothetical protein